VKIGYYPGCALHGSSNDYEQSLRACLTRLNVELAEIQDWTCCGATAAHSLNHKLSQALPARNLALAEQQSLNELLAPCPLCSMQLLKVSSDIKDADTRSELSSIVELPLEGRTRVLNLIEIFQKVGLDTLASAVTTKQESIQAACYYGCLLTRPPQVVTFDDPEQPHSMEAVLKALASRLSTGTSRPNVAARA
jgi:heterodisulfide reductase subunit B